jgi:hypothetical protein
MCDGVGIAMLIDVAVKKDAVYTHVQVLDTTHLGSFDTTPTSTSF